MNPSQDSSATKDRRKIKYLISYVKETGELKYVCENSYKHLGLKSNTDDRMSIFLDKNNLKLMCPDLFDKESQDKLKRGMVVDFDTTTMISSKRSLLRELEDEEDIEKKNGLQYEELSLNGSIDSSLDKDAKNVNVGVYEIDEKKELSQLDIDLMKSKDTKNKKNSLGDENSSEEDIDFMYMKRQLVAQEFHTECFEPGMTVAFTYFQDYQLSDNFIMEEPVLEKKGRISGSLLEKKNVNKKRRFLKRLENTIEEHKEEETIENSKILKTLNSSSLNNLYILASSVFIFLTVILCIKIYLRYDSFIVLNYI